MDQSRINLLLREASTLTMKWSQILKASGAQASHLLLVFLAGASLEPLVAPELMSRTVVVVVVAERDWHRLTMSSAEMAQEYLDAAHLWRKDS